MRSDMYLEIGITIKNNRLVFSKQVKILA